MTWVLIFVGGPATAHVAQKVGQVVARSLITLVISDWLGLVLLS